MLSHRNPLGYRTLLTWRQANEILELTEKFIATLPAEYNDIKDHM